MMNGQADGRDVYRRETRVFAHILYGKYLILQPGAAVSGPLQRLFRLFSVGEQLRTPVLQRCSLFLVVPAHDIAAGVIAARPVVLFMTIFVLDQTLDRDGA